ncbi:unnamed protein product [Cuscuta epithymum]|uniref:Uncharacterized protein n=1 Tax=Cuscuta epithymum TaxID=186058 RepID=A0AAV0CJQ6_9ASTE|nr:unnamed protein product [Cuscuta epithymum]CAH9076484.1 unnamed protein product [Cuscuta epithymum]CAH9139068.1 unnamed protein product [Cuscuta epithymum]
MMVKKPFTSPLCSKQATTSSANTYVSYPNIYHILSALELKYLMVQVQMLLYIVTEPVMLLSYMPLSEKLKKLGFVTYSNSQRHSTSKIHLLKEEINGTLEKAMSIIFL